MRNPRLLLLLLAALAMGATGCERKRDAYKRAKTEGLHLDAGGLKYQIQLSRLMNPKIALDRSLLRDVPPTEQKPNREQAYFGVWLEIENDSKGIHQSASQFEIEDSLGKKYEPIAIDPEKSPFYYASTRMKPHAVLPDPDSPPGQTSPGGLFLLFKLDLTAYQNRPLEFRIIPPVDADAEVELDL